MRHTRTCSRLRSLNPADAIVLEFERTAGTLNERTERRPITVSRQNQIPPNPRRATKGGCAVVTSRSAHAARATTPQTRTPYVRDRAPRRCARAPSNAEELQSRRMKPHGQTQTETSWSQFWQFLLVSNASVAMNDTQRDSGSRVTPLEIGFNRGA